MKVLLRQRKIWYYPSLSCISLQVYRAIVILLYFVPLTDKPIILLKDTLMSESCYRFEIVFGREQ